MVPFHHYCTVKVNNQPVKVHASEEDKFNIHETWNEVVKPKSAVQITFITVTFTEGILPLEWVCSYVNLNS